MADYEYDLAVVGAGIIGLAVGMRLTQDYPNLKVAVIEKEDKSPLTIADKAANTFICTELLHNCSTHEFR